MKKTNGAKEVTTTSKAIVEERLEKRILSENSKTQWFTDKNYANDQMDRIIYALDAFKNGDTTVRLIKEREDKFAVIATAYNEMVEIIGGVNTEVSRISRVAGVEGNLDARADYKQAKGVWFGLIESINQLIDSIAEPIVEVGRILENISKGDLKEKFRLTVTGDFRVMSETINRTINSLDIFAMEVTRVAREVGTEGILGGHADVPNATGTWKELTKNVNFMASNLTNQVREIATVATAVANGDLSQKISAKGKGGEVLQISNTINLMVDSLNTFASEVTRVAREVGTEGKLGGIAEVPKVAGTWKELTGSFNTMTSNLTVQVRGIATVATAVANGDLSQKITTQGKGGEVLLISDTINLMVDSLNTFASEVTRVAREVGTEGKLGGIADVPDLAGSWLDLTNNVNFMASNLTVQVREIATVATAVANGDLSQKITAEGKGGEVLQLSNTINLMVDSLNTFSSEVTRVAAEVGTEGILGGQAVVPNVAGSWKDLTDNVNFMADNLTSQVREFANVSTALASGDFSRKITVIVKGELLELKNKINSMVDSFVNIVDSANAISQGDFSKRTPLRGEGDQLSIALNAMTTNLEEISKENQREAWIKNGQGGLNDSMRGELDLPSLSKDAITFLTKYLGAHIGIFYVFNNDKQTLDLTGSFAYSQRKGLSTSFKLGEGLVGQAAIEKETIILSEIPDDYITITSGLGKKAPRYVIVTPFLLDDTVKGVFEIGSFLPFTEVMVDFLNLITANIAIAVNSAQDREKMTDLLESSQTQWKELQKQQESLEQVNKILEEQKTELKNSELKLTTQSKELTLSNEKLEDKAKDLQRQKSDIEKQNAVIEQSRSDIEEKAKELTLASKYKSEFLANMSHELRTPLNSLLILSNDLSVNAAGNLTEEQVKDAKFIYDGGQDLLNLINDILDISKVEAGKLTLEIKELKLDRFVKTIKNQFDPVAKSKNLKFLISKDINLPEFILSDGQRIEQIIRNLLSNAFKFTKKGQVSVRIHQPGPQTRFLFSSLTLSETIAISVTDTGMGVPKEKQRAIFEAFQQAEGGISREYGGTGLGLTISREMSKLLGGELHIHSVEGQGSTFTLYLPTVFKELSNLEISEAQIETVAKTSSFEIVPEEVTPLLDKEPPKSIKEFIPDDRNNIEEDDKTILIIEDDPKFAKILLDIAQKKGYKGIVTEFGKEGYDFALKHRPKGIILDIVLPDIGGLQVLDNLKFDLKTRHIPVSVISVNELVIPSLNKGALSYLKKPTTKEGIEGVFKSFEQFQKREIRNLLIIEDNKISRDATSKLLSGKDIRIVGATTKDAIRQLKKIEFDCIVLDTGLPNMTGFNLLQKIQADKKMASIPVVVYTGKDLSGEEYQEFQKYAESMVITGANSPERLLDNVSLFLHTVEDNFSESQRKVIQLLHDPELVLKGKKILLADDDVRNTYALSKTLNQAGLEVFLADNGKTAIEKLKEHPDVELILMDIMMPEMDGLEAMKRIRKMPQHKKLPIIALTANAMTEDKVKCIEAGANDYLTKPVSVEVLLSMMRIWLFVN